MAPRREPESLWDSGTRGQPPRRAGGVAARARLSPNGNRKRAFLIKRLPAESRRLPHGRSHVIRSRSRLGLALLALAHAPLALGVEISPGDDIRAAIAALGPGDELVLRAGVYRLNSRFNITVNGEADAPVLIRAKDGEDVLIEMSTSSHNILEIQSSRHLVLRNLRFTGGSH